MTARDVHDVIGGASSESVGGNVGCGWIELSYGVRVVPSAGVPAQDPSGPCP